MQKKIISMILAIAMVITMFAGIAVTTSAAETGSVFTKITSMDQLTDGEYLVVGATTTGNYTAKTGTMVNTGNAFMGYETPEIVDGAIVIDGEAVTATSVWTITKTADGYTIVDKDGKYLNNVEDTKNNARADEDVENLIIASGADVVEGTFTISRASGTYIYLNWNYNSGNSRFAFYNAQNNSSTMCAYLMLYKLGGSSAPELPDEPEVTECDHADAMSKVTTAATCTEDGVRTYTCDCGESWTEAIPATGHNYVNGVCTGCGDEVVAGDDSNYFEKIDSMSDLTDGKYLVVGATTTGNYTAKAGTMVNTGNAFMSYETPEIVNGAITVDGEAVTSASIWTITKTADGYTIVDKDGKYLNNVEDTKNTARADEDVENLIIASGADVVEGSFTISRASGTYIYLNWNYNSGNSRFAFYSAQNNTAAMCAYLSLYKMGEGSSTPELPDDPEVPECDHSDATSKVTTAATCTKDGVMTYTCACGKTWTEVIPATGHNYVGGVCSVCGDELPAGISYTLINIDNVPAGDYVIASTRKSTYATLYAATAAIAGDWKVSDTAVSAANDAIISSQLPADAQIFNFAGNNTDGFAISCTVDGVKQYLGYSDATTNRKLALSADYSNILWTVIEDPDGGFALSCVGTTYVISDNSDSATSIRGYASGNVYNGIYLFAAAAAEGECAHGKTEIKNAVAATCTESGYTGDTYCTLCGEKLASGKTIDALGHNFANGSCTNCGAKEDASYGLISVNTVTAGEYVIASTKKSTYETLYPATAKIDTYWTVSNTAITAKNDIITSGQLPADAQVFTFTGNNTDGFAISCVVDGVKQYLGYSDATVNNTLALGTEYASIRWTVIADSDGGFALSSATSEGAYVISDNSTAATSIRGYASGKIYNGIYLFKEGYTPVPDAEDLVDNDLKFSMDITAGAEMVVNYNFMASVVSKYEDFYLEVSKAVAGGEAIVTKFEVADFETMNHPTTGAVLIYNVSYTGINAKEMGDNFTTTLCGVTADGLVYRGATVTSSIRTFLLSKINDSASIDEMKTMAVDMLKYGAAAQTYFDYNTKNLVTNGLTSAQLAYATKGTAEAVDHTATSGTAASITPNITVGSKVVLGVSCINASVTDASKVKCVISDVDGNVLARPEVEVKANVMFSAIYDNVGARQMREVIKVVFKEGNKHVSQTLSWSVESYVAQVRANSTNANEIAVVNAMLIYGDSVAAYLDAAGM